MVHIGVCEDNEGVREVIKLLLEDYAKSSGSELDVRFFATEKEVLLKSDIDILILNVTKPEINGIELGKEARKKNRRLQLFYVTACEEKVLKTAGLTEYAYLRKPFNIDKFSEVIDELVRRVSGRRMLRMGICDDEEVIRDLIEFFINEYAAKNSLVFEIEKYGSGIKLLEDKKKLDLVFMDVDMPGKNGIEIGKVLRNRGEKLKIIYISAYPEYAAESYDVRADFYLLKPINKGKFFDVLDKSLKSLDLSGSEMIINIKRFSFHTSEIIYLKGRKDHRIIVCTKSGDIEIRGTLKEITEEVKANNFINIRRGIWINPIHIQQRDEKTVRLYGDRIFNLPRNSSL